MEEHTLERNIIDCVQYNLHVGGVTLVPRKIPCMFPNLICTEPPTFRERNMMLCCERSQWQKTYSAPVNVLGFRSNLVSYYNTRGGGRTKPLSPVTVDLSLLN